MEKNNDDKSRARRQGGSGKGSYGKGSSGAGRRGGSSDSRGGHPRRSAADGERRGPRRKDDHRGPRRDGGKHTYRRDDDRRGSRRDDDGRQGPRRDGERRDAGSAKGAGRRNDSFKSGDRARQERRDGHSRDDRKGRERFADKPSGGARRDNRAGSGQDRFRDRKALQGRRGDAPEKDSSSGGFKGFSGSRKPASKKPIRLTPARSIALAALNEVRERECYLSEALAHALEGQEEVSAKDRAFARLLATEAVSRLGVLDGLIDMVLSSPDDVEPEVRDALRLSFCELFYLDKAEHAAVDQGVELVRSVDPRATRLANFALHRVVEIKPEFPFGDPEVDDNAAALLYGYPTWLFQRLVAELGRERALRFAARSNEAAPLFFMVNVGRVDGAETLASLVGRGLRVAPVEPCFGLDAAFPLFVFAERTLVGDPEVERLLKDGGIVVSDLAAQSIAMAALPECKPARFLEIGAGRGTKSILLQNAAIARYGEQMPLDTLDANAARTNERTARLKRARIREDNAYLKDAEDLSDMPAESYDAVFVDAPCSGLGTLRRHPDIRWRVAPDSITSLAAVGSRMLEQAARLVVPGGRLTYATCTVFAEENEHVIDAFLESETGARFERVLCASTLDEACSDAQGPVPDAHFVCVLRRVS